MDKKYYKYFIIMFILTFIIGGVISYNLNKNVNKNKVQASTKEVNEGKKSNSTTDSENKDIENRSTENKEAKNMNNNVKKINVKEIPVIMYHSIDYEEGNELRVPKENFKKQMQYLKDNGYNTISLDELYDFIKNDSKVPEKPVILTFDDGYVDNYTNAYPIIKELGLKATVFIITSCIDKDKSFLTSEQIKEMDANGFTVESHTVNHDRLAEISYNEQVDTLKQSKVFLENILKREIKYIAYPYGLWNKNTLKAVEETGYNMAFTTEAGWAEKENGVYTLNRIYIKASASMDEFINRLTNSQYAK